MDSGTDARLRAEAMAWLRMRTHDGAIPLTRDELGDFTFDGEPFRLISTQTGIWKPAGMAAALSIRRGEHSPYADGVGPEGLPRYDWQGRDPEHSDNRALRAAKDAQLPLIWFFHVGPSTYQAVFPVYLLREEPEQRRFVVVVHDGIRELAPLASPVETELRRYLLRQTRQRLHQPVFRATVLLAYGGACAVCRLRQPQLLDAAHIVADAADEGQPVVSNGLAMCKIHHAAYDARILGVRPDYMVQIRGDILLEKDGPMLHYGLQARHGQRLMAVPRVPRERPDPARLAATYQEFLAAAG